MNPFTFADWRRLAAQLAGFFLALALFCLALQVLDPPDRFTRPRPPAPPPVVDLLAD